MKEEKTLNSKGKNLCDNEMESVTGGVGNISGNFGQKIGDPIYGRCSKCGERIITGYYKKNTAPPIHFCGEKLF